MLHAQFIVFLELIIRIILAKTTNYEDFLYTDLLSPYYFFLFRPKRFSQNHIFEQPQMLALRPGCRQKLLLQVAEDNVIQGCVS